MSRTRLNYGSLSYGVGIAAGLPAALACMNRNAVDLITVYRGHRRAVGKLTRATIDNALRYGLGALRAGDLAVKRAPAMASPAAVADMGRKLERHVGSERTSLLRTVGRLAREQGAQAYLVGGLVRDLLLGRANRDLDVVVVGDAAALAVELARQLGAEAQVHKAFGTATLFLDDMQLDLAMARRESYRSPGALPRVEPSGLQDDLLRRDFTVNCLAIALGPDRYGGLIDPCAAREDLRRRRIRVLHGLSFIEDPTRIFRALRLARRLRFELGPQTSRLVRVAIGHSMLELLSATRLRRELDYSMEEGELAAAVRSLQAYRLWDAIDPALRPGRGSAAKLERLDRLTRIHQPARHADRPPRWVAALTLLLLDRTAAQRRRVAERLRPDRRSRTLLLDSPREVSALRRVLEARGKHDPAALTLSCHRVSHLAVMLTAATTRSRRVQAMLRSYLEEWNRVRADLTGRDLIAAGIPEGPAVARGLERALRAKLRGDAPDRTSQLEIALKAAGKARGRKR
jgi:tRNA nucleotidyltransferase (CCA-adding enzyme)